MAALVRRQQVEVPVDFYGFALQESDDMEVPQPFPEGRVESSEGMFLTPFEMRLDIESAGHTHTAILVSEVWDGPPPPLAETGAWEAQGEAELFSVTGSLSIEVVAGRPPEEVELGLADTLWKVEVYCTGREEVARLAAVGVPEGVERYLARFWPAHP